MLPNYASAVILNNLVNAWNKTSECTNLSTVLKQYCLAYNDTSAPFKLNYGVTNFVPNISSQMNNLIVFGKGLCTTDLSANLVEVPDSNTNQFGFGLYDIIGNNDEISNCYILGAAYLTSRVSGVDVEFSIAKPSNNPTGENLLISKDISLDYVKDILIYSNDIVFPEPTTNAEYSILLYKFIIDIEKYVNDYNKDRAFINVYDFRQPYGFYGLSEEKVYTSMILNILQSDVDIKNTSDAELNNIKNIINTWMNLDSWSPSFSDYWATADPPMPQDLKDFIETYLGIII